ncbi:MAG: dynamin family protein [Ectobacillus sp.]
MTLENQLIKKTYYETFITETETNNLIQLLGEAYIAEAKNELSDISYIRFAQGELYYHSKDFEAAIFKWEKIDNELEPWAKKNIADSYFELQDFKTAEDIYTSIATESKTLQIEVVLQLFSLYIEQELFESAFKVIKGAVSLHPDYPNVTALARAFYEEQRDWGSAVELAVNEGIRTEALHWFQILKDYIDKGYTKKMEPAYFYDALMSLYKIDQVHFKEVVSSLWGNYKNEDSYLLWIQTINKLFLHVEINPYDSWYEISALYEQTYCELIDGEYAIKEIHHIVPNLLTNWHKLAGESQVLFAAAGILAWNEVFPSSMSGAVVKDAEASLYHANNYTDGLAYSLHLFESIMKWAQINELEVGYRFKWWVRELADLKTNHLLVAGVSGSGKSAFINSILGETILSASTATVIVFNDNVRTEINEITDTQIHAISDLSEFDEITTAKHPTDIGESCIEFKLPCRFLNKNALTLIDTPGFHTNSNERNETFNYLHLADSLLFVLNAGAPFTDKEREILSQIQTYAPDLPVHFLLNKMDTIYNEAEAARIIKETKERISELFPNAKVFPYSSLYTNNQQLSEFAEFIKLNFSNRSLDQERIVKLLFFIRKIITYLLAKRVEMENGFIQSIQWNEDILVKLNGFINNLSALEKEKAQIIAQSYLTIKDDITKEIARNIPQLLRGCSDLIHEESDFRHIHVELNEEMNKRIQDYLQETILPKFSSSIQEWIANANEEFTQSQAYLDEMSDTFNSLYEEERMKLKCDFRVLNDWQRDADRMTSRIQIDEVNIMLRFKPAQFLLKSAGKLFGGLGQNKAMLYNKYKKYLENEDYSEVAASVSAMFFRQFELFETSLERDITMFFREPFTTLKQTIEETHLEIQASRDGLSKMKARPELYHDPLTLFELRLRQYEMMINPNTAPLSQPSNFEAEIEPIG